MKNTLRARATAWIADNAPVLILAAIAGAGSFTHIRDTAAESGQHGWMAWAIAVCIDLMCVMAAREIQRDRKTGRNAGKRVTWPVVVLVAGVILSLAANLAQAAPTVWGWITSATPAVAFLVAVSMLERRAHAREAAPVVETVAETAETVGEANPAPAEGEPTAPATDAPSEPVEAPRKHERRKPQGGTVRVGRASVEAAKAFLAASANPDAVTGPELEAVLPGKTLRTQRAALKQAREELAREAIPLFV
ncbi:DUF2637 domain-containing protein [Microbispora rosea]|uniref:DUF2637 domain-containing protein n=1 Tax=Microbispora rosea TaxID=58117 RepID=UPI0037C89170